MNGTIETRVVDTSALMRTAREAIGCDTLDCVALRRGDLVMSVDDVGLAAGKPLNPKASALYRSVCNEAHQAVIAGDVVICHDSDFGGDPRERDSRHLRCEETSASGLCGAPAAVVVDNGDQRRYPMCRACAGLSVRNRGGTIIAELLALPDALDLVDIWFNPSRFPTLPETPSGAAHAPDVDLQVLDADTIAAGILASFGIRSPTDRAAACSARPTPYAVFCPHHGRQYLSNVEYNRQLSEPDNLWSCPICDAPSNFDDETYETATEEPPDHD